MNLTLRSHVLVLSSLNIYVLAWSVRDVVEFVRMPVVFHHWWQHRWSVAFTLSDVIHPFSRLTSSAQPANVSVISRFFGMLVAQNVKITYAIWCLYLGFFNIVYVYQMSCKQSANNIDRSGAMEVVHQWYWENECHGISTPVALTEIDAWN